jgi:hypothetical protein
MMRPMPAEARDCDECGYFRPKSAPKSPWSHYCYPEDRPKWVARRKDLEPRTETA